jgi:hypothetical protein
MTYTPSEGEKTCATFLQAASVFLFFVPALFIRWTHWGKSPYVRFWAKANLIWSLYLFIIVAMFFILQVVTGVSALFVVIWCAHALMTIMGAFAAMFNRPLGYFLVTDWFCSKEMSAVYGAAMAAPPKE